MSSKKRRKSKERKAPTAKRAKRQSPKARRAATARVVKSLSESHAKLKSHAQKQLSRLP